ncbi:TPR repeat-containing protein DDB_G0287407-like [Ptychodera flava]|uniref:TPR repeat-containing protein DDB_G0287407-like n=1 Tax=Ptychodera flava TaxID=63121 RepID=UPI00396A1DE0
MGCGASRLSHKSADKYKAEVEQIWDEVSKTVEAKKRGKKKKLVKRRRSGWKIIRIFVSSTFNDFHAEREILVKQIFPDLRQWCERSRLHLVECDLRWGVPKDATGEEKLRTCLEEIDRCYNDNEFPYFLNMTSERCGWIPTPDDVPDNLSEKYQWVNGLSVTEMEIMHGAYRDDNPNSLFAMRESSFLNNLPTEQKKFFVDSDEIVPEKLRILKSRLQNRFKGERFFKYKCGFDSVDKETKKVRLHGLDGDFTKKILEFFKKRIEIQYPWEDIELDPYEQEREAHESFMKNRSATLLGRTDILQQLRDHVTGLAIDVPLVLLGGPGMGKSSIMAKAADVAVDSSAKGDIPGGGDHGWYIFYHFVGAIPGSTDLEKMLKRFLKEMKICTDSNMPKDYETAAQLTSGVLSNPNTKPVIIIIDAANQFDDEKQANVLSWLPRKLAPQIRVLFSMINETPPHKILKERPKMPIEVEVTPLDMESKEKIVTKMLGLYNKKLDATQCQVLLAKESSQNPLWLSIACEELRVHGDFFKVTDKIKSLADGLLELLAQVLSRFEDENGGDLLIATLSLLESSSSGLLETELLTILGDEDNLNLPDGYDAKNASNAEAWLHRDRSTQRPMPLCAAKWAAVYRALRPFLRPFGDSGEGRLDFYHRSLSKAVRRKYFLQNDQSDEAESRNIYHWWHSKLADYFEYEQNIDRKVEEYPYQLVKIDDKKRLCKFLTEWSIFDKLYREDYCTELLFYWRKAGGYSIMEECYEVSLKELEEMGTSKEELALRYEHITRVIIQAGLYEKSKVLLETLIRLEEVELGAKPERMVEVYALCGELWDDITKMHEELSSENLEDLRKAIEFGRKSAAIRETLDGVDAHKYKLAITLMNLAFNLNEWAGCGGDSTLSPSDAIAEGMEKVERAINIFQKFGDLGKEAEANMTKAILYPRGSEEQIKFYELAEEQCRQAYGENCKLMTRLACNISIYHEERKDYYTAYDYVKKWYETCVEVFGESHPKTITANNILNNETYTFVAERLEAAST